MAYTTINKSSLHQNTVLYEGTGSSNAITGVGFQPDLTWVKDRDAANWNCLMDAVRGASKVIYSNASDAEATVATLLTSFDSDGFTVGTSGDGNTNTNDYVSWNWKANGAGSANTDGSINSTVSANATSKMSVVSWTGSGANATIGHGLGAVPTMIMVKNRSTADSWMVYNVGMGSNAYMHLDTTNAALSPSTAQFQATTPTSSVFSVGTADGTNKSSSNMIAFCFANVTGFSRMGGYVGNHGSTGTKQKFVYTGFKPTWLLLKNASATNGWLVMDGTRATSNLQGPYIYANADSAEGTVSYVQFFSNGFGFYDTNSVAVNDGGNEFIYAAFGQTLVGTNNIPTTAY